ncbi:MAG TPA: hypothetical protein VIM73_16300, partial [Polyangiaceae bacterium]
ALDTLVGSATNFSPEAARVGNAIHRHAGAIRAKVSLERVAHAVDIRRTRPARVRLRLAGEPETAVG